MKNYRMLFLNQVNTNSEKWCEVTPRDLKGQDSAGHQITTSVDLY